MAFFFFLSLLLTCNFHQTLARKAKETPATSDVYIVHVDVPKNQVATTMESLDLEMWYQSFLVSPIILSDSDDGSSSRIIYSYRNIFKGFAAKLSSEEVKEMSKKEGFISARPQKILPLHTTHTPNFLGLSQNLGLWKDSNYGKGVIIGVLDTGILPDHPSFDDEGMPPPPAKWTGKCDSRCNNKLIGTRHFGEQANSSADDEGHGTHTASTAAGSFVKGANVFGNANGTASGIAPMAHLAMYKVCTKSGCTDTDLLAGIDAAIQDGVDIISLSLGGISETFFEDSLALGAFTAIQKGIFVSASAGNMGPDFRTLSNEAPWILTVGASSVDRIIKVTALLGNNVSIDGESFSQPKDFPATMFPLVYPGSDKSNPDAGFCGLGSLRKINVTGKIVVCNLGGNVTRIIKERIVKSAGAAGIIVINEESDGYTTFAELHDLPAAHISYADGMKILAYIGSTPRPTTTLMFKGTVIGNTEAPSVSSFSSRGPSRASPGILKPDIIGPGTNILAAWPFSIENKTHTNITFNMISGTSMACPHLSGVAALIKSVHPDWSPAAIKSAIMTSADSLNLHHQPILDETLHTANVFATGSGHVNPSRASDPGLVYDLKPEDYIPYLCGLNYTSRQVRIITQRTVNCSEISNMDEAELNYPSFSIALGSTKKTYIRSVTNVGEGNSSYVVEINPPLGVTVSVEPTNLDFTETNETMSYQVTFVAQPATRTRTKFAQGFLKWNSAKHSVRSPIAVIFH